MVEKKDTFLDKPRLDNLTNEIWRSAERLRGKFKQYEYQKVVLPMIVLRRLECVLVDWREQKKPDIDESYIRQQDVVLFMPPFEFKPIEG